MSPVVSLLNDVMGPVMRGPSSSHTAGSHRIAVLAAALLGVRPVQVRLTFDPAGSYARVYRQQGSDRAFAAGFMGWPMTDDRFPDALEWTAREGIDLQFHIAPQAGSGHPNTVAIDLTAEDGRRLSLSARSIGGGAVEVTDIDGWPIRLTGETWGVFAEASADSAASLQSLVTADGLGTDAPTLTRRNERVLVQAHRLGPLPADARARLATTSGVAWVGESPPLAFIKRGPPLFESAADMVRLAEARSCSLGRLAAAYEAQVLGLPERDVLDEMLRRLDVMRAAVRDGLGAQVPAMQLLTASARQIAEADARGILPAGGMHTRAAARAMAVMHVTSGGGVVCAAPTGGSAGALAGVLVTLVDERGLSRERAALALFAASAVGLVVAARATFAAEVAGCQVEIGAAGAMGAAAVVDAANGTARQAADAAAIAFQNTMGSVCDLVQGMVEIPCHTRNALAASSAFVCADLIVGGYSNPIPLDETVDAVYAVGRMLPRELRCTALGGLAVTPSALRLVRTAPSD